MLARKTRAHVYTSKDEMFFVINFVAKLSPTAQKFNRFQNASLTTSIVRKGGANEADSKTKEERERSSNNGGESSLKPFDESNKELHRDIPEEEFILSTLNRQELVPEVPLMSLNIESRISRISKKGSFSADIFIGSYDHDFLTYPEPLDNRIENKQLRDQATMVRQLWPQIWNDPLHLQKLNFNNIYQLSVTEMMTIFEAIGASTRGCCESNNLEDNGLDMKQVTKSIISLITRNCLTYWPMHKSENQTIKSFLPKKHIIFGGASVDESSQAYPKIGFCWSEIVSTLGSLPPQEWLSFGQHGGQALDHYLITGKKNKVLFEDSTQHYLIYFRDKLLAEKYNSNKPDDEPNPASDPFVGCCIMHKSELNFSSIYKDSAGYDYVDVEFDTTVPGDRMVFRPERRDTRAINIKALGQTASCAVLIGLLKDTLRRTYVHLIDKKGGLLTCDIVERQLAKVTSKIFALESMLYYIAGMYDGLEDGFDAHMEAIILKIITNEFSYDILKDIQHICGSDLFILSKLQDQVNIFDSFLDGNIHNRLYLATMGIIWYARSSNKHLNQLRLAPWYPGYFIKSSFKEKSEQRDWLTLDADIYGNLHPSLKDAGANLEYIIKRVKWAADDMCAKYGSDVTGAQSALYKMAQLSIDSFMLTTMCARASKSYCNGSRNAELDVALTTTYSYDLYRRVKLYMEELQTIPLSTLVNRSREISQLNLKHGGYYAESPLDPNI